MYEFGSENIGEAQIQEVAKNVILMGDGDIKPKDLKLDIKPEDLKPEGSGPEDIKSAGKEL